MSKALLILWYRGEGGMEKRAQGVNFPVLTLHRLEAGIPRTGLSSSKCDHDENKC